MTRPLGWLAPVLALLALAGCAGTDFRLSDLMPADRDATLQEARHVTVLDNYGLPFGGPADPPSTDTLLGDWAWR